MNVNVPSAAVDAVFEMAPLVTTAVAPGITAPELSVSRPVTPAVCANAGNTQKQNVTIADSGRRPRAGLLRATATFAAGAAAHIPAPGQRIGRIVGSGAENRLHARDECGRSDPRRVGTDSAGNNDGVVRLKIGQLDGR